MRAHVTLEIKIGQLVALLQLEELAKLGVRENAATILRVLQVMGTNIGVNLTGNLGARHLSSPILPKEGSKLLANTRRLHKATGSTRPRLARALLAGLLLLKKLSLSGNIASG